MEMHVREVLVSVTLCLLFVKLSGASIPQYILSDGSSASLSIHPNLSTVFLAVSNYEFHCYYPWSLLQLGLDKRRMLPIQAILNRSPPRRPRSGTPHSQPSVSEVSSPSSDIHDSFPQAPNSIGVTTQKPKKARDSSDLTYTKPEGPINYPPFEDLDDVAYRQMEPFSVYPFGQIGQYCAHIPYSSDKKDVFEKTGRESFHVFVYRFTDSSDGQAYDVMWDFLGGFVRISPFFKSRKHKKTGPAKMLDANKGLRDISFHMTGGNRVAQGYWVPYSCARAVCTTFCYPIAGALIPIFGPNFPRDCIKPDSPAYGHMEIDSSVIKDSRFKVTTFRHSSSRSMSKLPSITSHPQDDAYSRSMKERLDHHKFDRPHAPSLLPLAPPLDLRINTGPSGPLLWQPTPEREHMASYTTAWNPINAPRPRESSPMYIDPALSASSYHSGLESSPPVWNSRHQRWEDEPRKHQLAVDEALYKRRRIDYQSQRPCERSVFTADSDDSLSATSAAAVDAHSGPDVSPVTWSMLDKVQKSPEMKSQEPPKDKKSWRYSYEEKEAASCLLTMSREPSHESEAPGDPIPTFPSLFDSRGRRAPMMPRAKSI